MTLGCNTLVERPPLRWHGSKWRLAPKLLPLFPEHHFYIEPFGGGASVLLRKPRVKFEVYNDLDRDVVEFFEVLRSARREDLIQSVGLTPFSRAEFDAAFTRADDPVERARHMLVRSHMGFATSGTILNGRNTGSTTGFRSNGIRSGTAPQHTWSTFPPILAQVAERLSGVVIECRPAIELLDRYNRSDAFFYIDPPYLPETRDRGADYAHEMTREQHVELLQCVRVLDASVMLSGYPSDLYDEELEGWRRLSFRAHAEGSLKRVEVVWLNYEPPQGGLDL